MIRLFSQLLDAISNYLARRKGLLPIIGMILIVLNFILRLLPDNWLTTTDLFLHLGIVTAILGLMLQKAL